MVCSHAASCLILPIKQRCSRGGISASLSTARHRYIHRPETELTSFPRSVPAGHPHRRRNQSLVPLKSEAAEPAPIYLQRHKRSAGRGLSFGSCLSVDPSLPLYLPHYRLGLRNFILSFGDQFANRRSLKSFILKREPHDRRHNREPDRDPKCFIVWWLNANIKDEQSRKD